MSADAALFLTGGNGFLGRRLLAALPEARRARCTLLLREGQEAPGGFRIVRGDLLDATSYADAIEPQATVVHLAALTGKATRARHLEVNEKGTTTLIEAAKIAGARRFLFLSSIAVQFENRAGYHYAEAKDAAERRLRTSGLECRIVRPTMIFGPGSPVQEGLAKLACMPMVPLFGGGKNRVQPVHVDDLARYLADGLDRDFAGDTFSVAGAETTSMRELLERLAIAERGKPRPFLPLPIGLFRGLLRLVEPVLLPVLPLTAGQIASFANDVALEGGAPGEVRLERGLDAMIGADS